MASLSATVGVDGVEDPEFVLRAGLGRDYVGGQEFSISSCGDEGGGPNLEREHVLL